MLVTASAVWAGMSALIRMRACLSAALRGVTSTTRQQYTARRKAEKSRTVSG